MLRILLMAVIMIWALGAVQVTGRAHAQGVANITIPFAGSVANTEEIRRLIAASVKALLPEAKQAGAVKIRVQSDAYTLTPNGGGFNVNGNIFINVVPESKTADFITNLQKRGFTATANYFQACR